MRSLFIVLMIFYISYVQAQKSNIDKNALPNWVSLNEIGHNISSVISNNGRYFIYEYQSTEGGSVVVVKSTNSERKVEFPKVVQMKFSPDSERAFFSRNDTLFILKLDDYSVSNIDSVESFQIPSTGYENWIAYKKQGREGKVIVKNIESGDCLAFLNVDIYKISQCGNQMLLKTNKGISYYDLVSRKEKPIAQSRNISTLIFDDKLDNIAFVLSRQDGNEIWNYKKGMDSAAFLLRDDTSLLKKGYAISTEQIWFSRNYRYIFFQLEVKDTVSHFVERSVVTNLVDIWNYHQKYLPEKDYEISQEANGTITAVTDIEFPKIIPLVSSRKELYMDDCVSQRSNRYGLVQNKVNEDEFYWNKDTSKLYLVDNSNGQKIFIDKFSNELCKIKFISPDDKFVVWYSPEKKAYFSYDIRSRVTRNISHRVPSSLYDDQSDVVDRKDPFGIAGWLPGDSAILVYDRFDIWSLDPMNERLPLNLTKQHGRKQNLIFRLIKTDDQQYRILKGDSCVIVGFNNITKDNGFFKLLFKHPSIPRQLTMGPYVFHFSYSSRNILVAPSEDLPQKARDSMLYIVRRMSATESPNLYKTTNFIDFYPLTDIHPERMYNWLTSELIRWKLPNGIIAEGILYKPENFDSSRLYPVIVHYYEKLSNGLNTFKKPQLSEGILNIPWFVSNEYVVFVPNIYYQSPNIGASVVNTLISAVNKLKSYSWINKRCIGLQGHSFGGFETLFTISHTEMFAAAQESGGYTNSTSYYNHNLSGASFRSHYFDVEQGNLGCAPWEDPQLYINNSPIFFAKNIRTPLLIMHNKGDNNVPFSQGLDMFLALRRMKRSVWLLQYDNEGHIIFREDKNKMDFTIRQQQFFDFYLKGASIPGWMSTGVEQSQKGYISGL